MALQGNLSEFSFVQLLNLVNLAKKTGALYVEGANQGSALRLFFRDGKMAHVLINNKEIPLIRMLARAKLIPNAQAASMCEKYKGQTDKELGIILINSGILSQEKIFSGIESFFREILQGLFLWKEGSFHFENNEFPSNGVIQARMDLENLILEGSRQMVEQQELAAEIPSLELTLKFTDRPGIEISKVNLNAEEWRVVSFVNPKNSIQQIATAARLTDFQVRRAVFNLLQAGLVELVRPSGAQLNPVEARMKVPQRSFLDQSLLNRVIERIKAI